MPVTVRSFAKINLGLRIGTLRPDGFHQLRTVYQTIALHDIIRVQVSRGTGIEIRCVDPRVPKDESNTCYRIAERAMAALKTRGRVVIEIEKRLPVQGGLGGASSNAVAALLALERALKKELPDREKLRVAAQVVNDQLCLHLNLSVAIDLQLAEAMNLSRPGATRSRRRGRLRRSCPSCNS